MRIALCSTIVPFIDGGARQIVDWLEEALIERGHEVEKVYLPETDDVATIYSQMMAFRWIDLSHADRVVCFRPQSHLIRHPHKVLWFIHHLRMFYDLWDSQYRTFPDDLKHRAIRDAVQHADMVALHEARRIFTNSATVSERLRKYNSVDSEVLYPPIHRPERFAGRKFNDEVVYISRVEPHKRQHLLIEALAHTTTPLRIRICGTSEGGVYPAELCELISQLGVKDRVTFDGSWISEEEKSELLADCLASVYIPLDEDSYGYPTLEAAHAGKPTLTTTDSGGVLEFVQHEHNGLVSEPDPISLAHQLDRLYLDRAAADQMGKRSTARIDELGVSWDRVIERLLD